jgi:hypothetical protein
MTSPLLRHEVVDALRRGTVPRRGLELIATGTERFEEVLDEELSRVAAGGSAFKAIRGPYGCGKTYTARWFQARALAQGFAVAEVQISANDTPLHKLETVYRRVAEGLRTAEWHEGAFRNLLTAWLDTLEDEVLDTGIDEDDDDAIAAAVDALLEQRLAVVSNINPQFGLALRACHRAQLQSDYATSEGLMAWLMGQPNVGANHKRQAGLTGALDHTGAMAALRGLLTILRQSGRKGLMLVLDETEIVQRMRADTREKSLEALRKLIDDIDSAKFPGLYVVITGTPEFFDGPHGVRIKTPLAQRLHVDFGKFPEFDSLRDVQIRLMPFTVDRLVEVGHKVRALYPAKDPERLDAKVPPDLIARMARAVAGELGGKVGVAPRIFLRKLVGSLLDKVDLHEAFDPEVHLELSLDPGGLTPQEAAAAGLPVDLDDLDLDVG